MAADVVDYGLFLEDYLASIENLPGEIQFLMTELQRKDDEYQEVLRRINSRQTKLFMGSSRDENVQPDQEKVTKDKIRREIKRAEQLSEEKTALAKRAYDLLNRQLQRLNKDMTKILPDTEPLSLNESFNPAMVSASMRNVTSSRYSDASAGSPQEYDISGDEYEPEGGDDDKNYCICQGMGNGTMIGCDNEDCPTEWYHLSCVGLREPPEGTWYCPQCADVFSGDRSGRKRRRHGRSVGAS